LGLRFHDPCQTLQEFLGVLIPEVVSVGVIIENPRAFALVIPMEVGALTAGQGT